MKSSHRPRAILKPVAEITAPERKLNLTRATKLLRGVRDGGGLLPAVSCFESPVRSGQSCSNGLHRYRVSAALGFASILATHSRVGRMRSLSIVIRDCDGGVPLDGGGCSRMRKASAPTHGDACKVVLLIVER